MIRAVAPLPTLSPEEVRFSLLTRREIALLDLREEEQFAEAHPLFASQLPLGRLELEILDRVPRKDTLIVVYDDTGDLVRLADARLGRLGYTNVHALAGGLEGWRSAGYELFRDVNSYSKAFGELVEARRHTPSLSAPDVQALVEERADIAILDARRFEEYATMSIPTGVSVPGAELVLRAAAVAPDPDTTIIINCAGRTRSIIGTQSLINAGIPNRVVALRNGTIGWTLAKQSLEHGRQRQAPVSKGEALEQARQRARTVAYRAGVRRLTHEQAFRLGEDKSRTLYRFDVRTPEEYGAGHIAGFRSAPGGQLVQETDVFAPVRGARILLADDIGPRADMTASWLAQLGWEVYVLDGGFDGELVTGDWQPTLPPLPHVEEITADKLSILLERDAVAVLDLATSRTHAAGHIPGARFALRTELPQILEKHDGDRPVVLISPDGALARLGVADLFDKRGLRALAGGTAAWVAAGKPLSTGLTQPLSPPVDIYKRPYEGTDNAAAAMRAYLDWEFGLVAQLERDGSHGFFVI